MRARPGLESAPVADRSVLYAPDADQVLVLQPLASLAWSLAGEGRSSQEIADQLAARSDAPTADAVLAELIETGALVETERPAPALRPHRGRFVEVMGATAALAALNVAATALGLSDAQAVTAPSSGGYAAPAA